MEEVIDNQEITYKRHKVYDAFNALLSALVSLFISGFSFYIASKGTFWFYAIGAYFALEGLFIFIALLKKDAYKAMRLQGIFQIISIILFMSYLLFMVLWNDPDSKMDYSFTTYLIFAASCGIKLFLSLISSIVIKKDYDPLLHSYRNIDLISAFYLALIFELTMINQYYPGSSYAIFDNLLKEKPIWTYIITIGSNAVLTSFAALLGLSTTIRAKTREQLSTKSKIKHTVRWFNENEVSMFFGLIFTMYLAILALIHMKQSIFYIFLFAYYVGSAFIRVVNYVWHKNIQKTCGDNITRENRLSSWILLFDAVAYLLFSNVLAIGAIFMMVQKAKTGENIYLFLFMLLPMAIMRFITANKSIHKNRQENNTYKLGVSLVGLISVFFTLLQIVAIVFHGITIIWIRYTFIILAIITVKIAVIVVAIIFVVHWIRSMILNSRRKERRLKRQKERDA